MVTGIRAGAADADKIVQTGSLQWGPVVVTGISDRAEPPLVRFTTLQWGPVVVTGIRRSEPEAGEPGAAASMGVSIR